jgi:hypothetical protein
VNVTNRRKSQTWNYCREFVFTSIRDDHARPAMPAGGRTPFVSSCLRGEFVSLLLRAYLVRRRKRRHPIATPIALRTEPPVSSAIITTSHARL